jgi:exodeoxyribonuclease-5
MDFAPQQVEALSKIRDWHGRAIHGDAPQVFRLFGYAGTGKTTIAKSLSDLGKVQYAAYTGKASLVLRTKGCENASTIHSLIYRSVDKSVAERDEMKVRLAAILEDPSQRAEAEELQRAIEEKNRDLLQPGWMRNEHAFDRYWDEELEQYCSMTPPTLIVIDECSMVDKRIGQDLEAFQIPILVLGDPAQLPPVSGAGYFTGTKDNPVQEDYLLTEIHRQAADNPVLRIATSIRTNAMPPIGQYGTSRIVPKRGVLEVEDWLEADQILAGMNATRRGINHRIRTLKGYSGLLPCVGEKVICLRNNHELGLLNGSLWTAVEVEDMPDTNFFRMTVESMDDADREPVQAVCHKKPFLGLEFEDQYERRDANEFDFGHCITTHKSQGSEWSNVIYIDEWTMSDKRRHQYTGVTRARDRVTVVKWKE